MEVKFNNNNGPKSQICLYKRRPQLSKTLFKCLTRVSLSHPRDLPSLPVLGSLACGVTLTLVQQIFFFLLLAATRQHSSRVEHRMHSNIIKHSTAQQNMVLLSYTKNV